MEWFVGNFGFSYIGLIFMLMLTIPNLIWAKSKPIGYDGEDENKILLSFERVGQVLVTCCALVFTNFSINIYSLSWWSAWLVVATALMVMYEIWWVRYFKGRKTTKDFYSSFCKIPVAGATLPVIAFFILGIYGKSAWMLISVVILGIGHIGIHLQHLKEEGKSA